MLKRYWVFWWDVYYPSGGWNDFISDHDTEEEAKLVLDSALNAPNRYREGLVLDSQTGDIVGEEAD